MGDSSTKKISVRKTYVKQILRAVIGKKKILAGEATCIVFKVIYADIYPRN